MGAMSHSERRGARGIWAVALILSLSCINRVSRDRWEHMSPDAKRDYVVSMIGGENAKRAKGGSGRTYSRPVQTYVADIDHAYAHGDRRDPAAIFTELADRR